MTKKTTVLVLETWGLYYGANRRSVDLLTSTHLSDTQRAKDIILQECTRDRDRRLWDFSTIPSSMVVAGKPQVQQIYLVVVVDDTL